MTSENDFPRFLNRIKERSNQMFIFGTTILNAEISLLPFLFFVGVLLGAAFFVGELKWKLA